MPWLNPTKEFWLVTYQIISLYFILMIVFALDVTNVFIVKRSFSPQNKQALMNDPAIADWNSIHSSEDT